jgi:hypothetical protein
MGQVRIRLNKNFYDRKSVEEALFDFGEICEGKIVSDEIEVLLSPGEDIENISEEFCNYVLGLMKNNAIV